jgi:hypothetical protein
MKNKTIFSFPFIGIIIISSMLVFISTNLGIQKAQAADPILDQPYVYESYDTEYGGWIIVFEVFYTDLDGDDGTVICIYNNDQEITMNTDLNMDPAQGRYYWVNMVPETIFDDDEFYFYAEDTTGNTANLGSGENPYLVGDYLGWGEKPVMSNPGVYFDDDTKDYVFNVTYWDPEGDVGYVSLNVFTEGQSKYYEMGPVKGNPEDGQNFEVSVPNTVIDDNWEYYFDAWDEAGSTAYLPDQSQSPLKIANELGSNGGNGGGNGGGSGGGDTGTGIQLSEGWAEVLVGVAALAAVAGGSAYGMYRRKKKHGRFSELLTQLDEIYASYKLNPQRCETELEKIKGTINEDLKKSTIDDNNYSILKGRIDEILSEIRSESIRTEVAELPKDIELKIKDMLIDGEITRAEYDKILPIIKGSTMSSDEKEKVKKMVESYMVEEKKE